MRAILLEQPLPKNLTEASFNGSGDNNLPVSGIMDAPVCGLHHPGTCNSLSVNPIGPVSTMRYASRDKHKHNGTSMWICIQRACPGFGSDLECHTFEVHRAYHVSHTVQTASCTLYSYRSIMATARQRLLKVSATLWSWLKSWLRCTLY